MWTRPTRAQHSAALCGTSTVVSCGLRMRAATLNSGDSRTSVGGQPSRPEVRFSSSVDSCGRVGATCGHAFFGQQAVSRGVPAGRHAASFLSNSGQAAWVRVPSGGSSCTSCCRCCRCIAAAHRQHSVALRWRCLADGVFLYPFLANGLMACRHVSL